MTKTLKFIGISHRTASVMQREEFHISELEKETLSEIICKTFSDVSALLILATCNRSEIYFESTSTSAAKIRDFIIIHKTKDYSNLFVKYFTYSNNTEESARHLLDVATGLESMIIGDAEIIHQIKKAYQFSIAHKLQGSLLERALQAVFISHKRISNETHFRDGTTSVAYKSLKAIRNSYGKAALKNKSILFIGAGDIVKQLFKYNSKFNFKNIFISNRTSEKAQTLANIFKCKTYNWNKVLNNEFDNFDVIISAASNCHHLIKKIPQTTKKLLLIDLAVPSNIDKSSINRDNIVFYDLDLISVDLEETKEKRLAAIDEVNIIISEEFAQFKKWLEDAVLRDHLVKSKSIINQKVKDLFKNQNEELNERKIEEVTNKVMRKWMSQPYSKVPFSKIDAIIAQQVSLLSQV
ncbi:glutamyl-tRNA reductase [Yeosuana sp. MJ-SS3]|uniref:Glutamyl-tRNA reductase n=1 Tax=Gilvirhabdus luticola TaxID=3079858 RepID=A0ABU3U3U7_9FLAO|nr:glutamyl-tRNA reductase [Yeosuana sp. MJ-SS3]MDU8884999.1 glutamyl-tRNA reductase [Yeosuana sp. MJ-SS3]